MKHIEGFIARAPWVVILIAVVLITLIMTPLIFISELGKWAQDIYDPEWWDE